MQSKWLSLAPSAMTLLGIFSLSLWLRLAQFEFGAPAHPFVATGHPGPVPVMLGLGIALGWIGYGLRERGLSAAGAVMVAVPLAILAVLSVGISGL